MYNSTCITSANLERFIVHECIWREEDSINLHNFNGKCVLVASFLPWNTLLVGFPLETHNGKCTASQSMHAARQLRAEPTLLEFACGSSFSQDTRSLVLPAGCCIDWSTYTYLRHKMFRHKGEDSETYDTRSCNVPWSIRLRLVTICIL